MSPTFSGKLDRNCCRKTGDVTHGYVPPPEEEKAPKNGKHLEAADRQKCRIPVDNLEFSTFSTGFSTRVFHMENRGKNRVVFHCGRHNYFRLLSTKFYFFGTVHFDQRRIPGKEKET